MDSQNRKEAILEAFLIKKLWNEIDVVKALNTPISTILLIGAWSELLIKELVNEKGGTEKILKKFRGTLISESQYQQMDEIRTIRNKYTHIDFNELLEHDGYAIIDDSGMVTLLPELVHSNDDVDSFYLYRASIDARRVVECAERLRKSLE